MQRSAKFANHILHKRPLERPVRSTPDWSSKVCIAHPKAKVRLPRASKLWLPRLGDAALSALLILSHHQPRTVCCSAFTFKSNVLALKRYPSLGHQYASITCHLRQLTRVPLIRLLISWERPILGRQRSTSTRLLSGVVHLPVTYQSSIR